MQLREAEVVEKRTLTPVVRHVALRLLGSAPFAFLPGQFIQFILDAKTLRQFSIASLPEALPRFELCVDISPMGRGSRFVEGMKPGDRVTFRGPFGVFVVPSTEGRSLEFVATGAGIAPIRAMIRSALQRVNPTPPRVALTFGNRTLAEVLYHDAWRSLAAAYPSFTYRPTLSQPPDTWDGERGRVTDVLERRADLAGRPFFICGAPAMVDDVREVLAARRVDERDVHFEKFH